jgi:hypothetical protein
MPRPQVSYTILDFGFWIVKALPVASFKNSNVASLNPNGISHNSTQEAIATIFFVDECT